MAPPAAPAFDRDLADLPPALRWREWMARIEAVIFAAAQPVPRAVLATVIGDEANLDLLIADIRRELAPRPYELVSVAGGYQLRTHRSYATAVRASGVLGPAPAWSKTEMLTLAAIAYFQPLTRAELTRILGREISRDVIARLRRLGMIDAGPRSPQPGAPYTYITTAQFLATWGYQSLHDLPDMEKLEDAGLLSKERIADIPLLLPDDEG
ncbi:MAG: SMC-Scp complex subunit ScpB [Acidobacteriaceae bacterium]|nr:SMC-Scp complex subunit ScpB [Acidobacteriaceae bacterium]